MEVRKVRNVQRLEDDVYSCTIEIFVQEEKDWKRVPYVARKNDDSPINQWILKQLETGKYKILDQRK